MIDVVLPAKPGFRAGPDLVEPWLLANGGAVPLDGVMLWGDGTARFSLADGAEAVRDAVLAAWAAFDPSAPTPAEIEDERRRVEALALLDKLDRAPTTVTITELRKAVLYALRRALRDGG